MESTKLDNMLNKANIEKKNIYFRMISEIKKDLLIKELDNIAKAYPQIKEIFKTEYEKLETMRRV